MSPLRKLLAVFAALAIFATACGEVADVASSNEAEAAEDDTTATESTDDTATDTTNTAAAPPVSGEINGGKPEVVPEGDTPLELGIEDLIVGDGAEAQPGDNLAMHYVGVLHDNGEQFDASWDRGETFNFVLGQGQVIRGWDEGIVGMRAGGRRVLSIPAEQAYGTTERGGIPANSALVFVVDLVEVTEGIEVPVVENAPAPVTELEVVILEEGDGPELVRGDVIEAHYQIILQPTGDVIDSSYTFGQPIMFALGVDPTIPAWDMELIGKRVGDVVRMVIPPELGINDPNGSIPADATLVTEMTIINVVG